MRSRSPFSALRFISVVMIVLAMTITVLQLVRFSRLRANFPAGLVIADIPVGGLSRPETAERLRQAYGEPIEIRFNGAPIHLSPSVIDFELDLEAMLAAADLDRTDQSFWVEFWDYLWGRTSGAAQVPLRFNYSEQRLRAFLEGVAERYDQPPEAAQPVAGTVNFTPGQPGVALDIDEAILPVELALQSPYNRAVELPLTRTSPPRPAFQNLQVQLQQTIQVSGFDGLVDVYLLDLQTVQEMHFAVQSGETISVQPDIAFTASSIIKIPIMVSAYRRLPVNPDPETDKLLSDMIEKSGNEAADWLMDRVIDDNRGPLLVTEDMQALGLSNTFMAGYFSLGSPLLATFETPANQRPDINTDPDIYSQTTPAEIGMLLADLYQCAQSGGSALAAVFPGQFDDAKCQSMINLLTRNKLPVLLTAGIPDGTQIAHKHGWVTTNGVINTLGDAGIIYSPGGTYVLVVFLHHPNQLIWEPASEMVADLSQAVYNYYNLPAFAAQ